MFVEIPFEPSLFGIQINVHLFLEYMAFFLGFRYYIFLRKKHSDEINNSNRLSIILGAALGALIGSRLVGFLENPMVDLTRINWTLLLNTKTIMGGLFGGLLGVELIKKIIKEKKSSGDLFVFPLILGIFIGRIGCFLSGVSEFTYGKVTTSIFGMNLGDGYLRHPIALYELFFLIILFILLKKVKSSFALEQGGLFKLFMIVYFGFRFFIEFLKPNVFYIIGLSTIQILCIICWIYYFNYIITKFRNARKKIYLL